MQLLSPVITWYHNNNKTTMNKMILDPLVHHKANMHIVRTLANGYIKSAPLPRVTDRAAHVTTVTARHQVLTPVPYGLAPVPLSSPMTKHHFSHESESFVQPLIMRQDTSPTTSYYLTRVHNTVLIN